MAATVVLSEDLIETEILTRLPVKSLVRFRSVCNLWKSLFSSPNFIESHLHLASQNPKIENLVVNKWIYEIGSYSEISILNNNNISETKIPDVPYDKKSNFSLIGSINGLVCLLECSVTKQIILWNPATRRCKKIYHHWQIDPPANIYGFSWDSVENDYKVVLCDLLEKKRKESGVSNNGNSSLVYSCNSGVWRPLCSFSFPISVTHSCTPDAIVKGVPFWTFTNYYQEKEKRICRSNIVKFEAGCNEFKLLPVFENYAMPEGDGFLLVCSKDRLTVMLYNQRNSDSLVDLYWLDEGCGVWRRMYKVGPIPSYNSKLWHCFNYGGEIVFCIIGDIFCYDSKTNKVKGFGNQKAFLWQCFSYKASLVSVDGMESLHMGNPAYSSGPSKTSWK